MPLSDSSETRCLEALHKDEVSVQLCCILHYKSDGIFHTLVCAYYHLRIDEQMPCRMMYVKDRENGCIYAL